ncbi:MAG: DNA primase [Xanthobacteraceae bacterium]
MRFPPHFLDELRARIRVSEVVGRRVKLRKSGREWCGLSPFNREKTPSFFVNDEKSMWFDFSAGRNGNIFDFVMLTEGVSFPEAVERLAQEAGVPLPKFSREEELREQRRKTLHDILEAATLFFQETLASRTGAKVRGYLSDRGIDPATILKFRLGYAPADRFLLKEHLGKEGISTQDMVEAGLLISGGDIPLPYDRFRDRVMFPILDARERPIAFGGRALDAEVPAKYLNSPETPLFHKGATLYNLPRARAAAHRGAPLVAVEGYVDTIAMVSAGYEATVAPLGTALTVEQLALLWKMADEPILCFDGDVAGRRAAYRAADLAVPLITAGKSLKFALLPEGQDPDDLLRLAGVKAMAEVIGAACPLVHMLWMRETEAGSLETPERRAALEARLQQVAMAIGDNSVRKHYRREFDERLRTLFEPNRQPFEDRGRRFRPHMRGARLPQRRVAQSSRYVAASPQLAGSPIHRGSVMPRREALILQAVINHPWLLHEHLEELATLELRHPDAAKIKPALIDIFAQMGAPDAAGILAELGRRGLGQAADRIQKVITTSSVWGAQAGAAPDDVLLTWSQLVALHRQWHSLTRELREAEQALGRDSTEANYSWLQDIKARQWVLEGTEALIEGFGAASGRAVKAL